MNEVRYFHTGDAALATALADALRALWPSKVVKVQDLSASRFGSAGTGLLEVWVSE
jgi:hypothetical protein